MPDQPLRKLITKLTEIMKEVAYIQKTGYNRQQNYKYAQEADVVEKVRRELAKRKVFLKNDVKEYEVRKVTTSKGTELTIVALHIEYTFIDGETGERESFTLVAEGQDTGDKAAYKAMTGGLKYALMKSFMIPTGDDPEREAEEDAPKVQPTTKQHALATDKQRKAVYSIAKGKGLSDEEIKALLEKFTGKASTKSLTKKEASNWIETIEPMAKEELLRQIT